MRSQNRKSFFRKNGKHTYIFVEAEIWSRTGQTDSFKTNYTQTNSRPKIITKLLFYSRDETLGRSWALSCFRLYLILCNKCKNKFNGSFQCINFFQFMREGRLDRMKTRQKISNNLALESSIYVIILKITEKQSNITVLVADFLIGKYKIITSGNSLRLAFFSFWGFLY